MASLSIGAAVIGGVGSLIGGSKQSSADKQAAQQSMTGYNYLTTGAGASAVNQYINSGTAASTAQAGTRGAEAALLGVNGTSPEAKAAAQTGFSNYLNSTGSQFQLKSGSDAITGSAAAKGILNSGATGKALTQYGQNLGSSYFNNYLTQLGSLNTQQGNTAALGSTTLGQVGAAGTGGGANAAGYTQAAGNAQSQSLNNALGMFTNAFSQIPSAIG